MLYYTCIDKERIIGYDILNLAHRKGQELKAKYPNSVITVEWSSWYEGKKVVKGESNYNIVTL